jgi:hypothetical protein
MFLNFNLHDFSQNGYAYGAMPGAVITVTLFIKVISQDAGGWLISSALSSVHPERAEPFMDGH